MRNSADRLRACRAASRRFEERRPGSASRSSRLCRQAWISTRLARPAADQMNTAEMPNGCGGSPDDHGACNLVNGSVSRGAIRPALHPPPRQHAAHESFSYRPPWRCPQPPTAVTGSMPPAVLIVSGIGLNARTPGLRACAAGAITSTAPMPASEGSGWTDRPGRRDERPRAEDERPTVNYGKPNLQMPKEPTFLIHRDGRRQINGRAGSLAAGPAAASAGADLRQGRAGGKPGEQPTSRHMYRHLRQHTSHWDRRDNRRGESQLGDKPPPLSPYTLPPAGKARPNAKTGRARQTRRPEGRNAQTPG
jgi:hypothetical protein